MKNKKWNRSIWLLALLFVGGCCTYPNLTFHKNDLVAYYESGKYEHDVAAVAEKAKRFIQHRVASKQTNLAIVLDIDETALSDWGYMKGIDFGFEKQHFDAWIERAEAPAIKPILGLFQTAQELGIKTFFVTGRKEHLRQATQRNLAEVGYAGFAGLFMRPEAGPKMSTKDYKASVREKLIKDGYIIIANVGDQDADLAGGFAERSFKIPNPFYFSE